jgi:hypothetical protein
MKMRKGVLRKCCDNVFQCLVQRGTEVKIDTPIEQVVRPSADGAKSIRISLYSTAVLNPLLVKPSVCKLEGELIVPMPVGDDMNRSVLLSFNFGGTELTVRGVDEKSLETREVTVTFGNHLPDTLIPPEDDEQKDDAHDLDEKEEDSDSEDDDDNGDDRQLKGADPSVQSSGHSKVVDNSSSFCCLVAAF